MHMLKKEMMTVLVVQHLGLYLEGIKGGRGSATLVRYDGIDDGFAKGMLFGQMMEV